MEVLERSVTCRGKETVIVCDGKECYGYTEGGPPKLLGGADDVKRLFEKCGPLEPVKKGIGGEIKYEQKPPKVVLVNIGASCGGCSLLGDCFFKRETMDLEDILSLVETYKPWAVKIIGNALGHKNIRRVVDSLREYDVKVIVSATVDSLDRGKEVQPDYVSITVYKNLDVVLSRIKGKEGNFLLEVVFDDANDIKRYMNAIREYVVNNDNLKGVVFIRKYGKDVNVSQVLDVFEEVGIDRRSFYPLGALIEMHPLCAIGTVLVKEGKGLKPITEYMNVDNIVKKLNSPFRGVYAILYSGKLRGKLIKSLLGLDDIGEYLLPVGVVFFNEEGDLTRSKYCAVWYKDYPLCEYVANQRQKSL